MHLKELSSSWTGRKDPVLGAIRTKKFLVVLLLLIVGLVVGVKTFVSRSPKFVIILGANKGGGVLQWKGAKEWDLEKISIANKKEYASRHGYHLAVKDMMAKKKYTHEWRESWQRVDIIRETMRQFPDAEWFWWLDLETFIMEPKESLQSHIFNHLDSAPRNCSNFNPAGFDMDLPFVDQSQPIDMLLTLDCSGFSLGSFFIRRSEFTELLLDIWWDPVMYEQKHMEWIHGEQAALQYLYNTQAWIRSHIALPDLRLINAYPPGACSEAGDDPRFFYNENARDFMVNMAGCQFGRDCWGEIEEYKRLSNNLNSKKRLFFF